MPKLYLNLIEKRRKKIGIPRAELSRRISIKPDTLNKFLKSGRKVNDHLNLIFALCKELDLDWKDIIK